MRTTYLLATILFLPVYHSFASNLYDIPASKVKELDEESLNNKIKQNNKVVLVFYAPVSCCPICYIS